MEIIREIFSYISGLGNYVMIPIMITLVGLIVRLKPVNAIRAGMTVGIGLIGMNMILNLLWTYISPVASTLVDMSNINLTTMDIGWTAAAGLAFSTVIGSFIIPFILLVNILMLITRCTRTINIDLELLVLCIFRCNRLYFNKQLYLCFRCSCSSLLYFSADCGQNGKNHAGSVGSSWNFHSTGFCSDKCTYFPCP